MREVDMKRYVNTVRPAASTAPSGLLLAACALLIAIGGAAPAAAQLPAGSPTFITGETFNVGSAGSAPFQWEAYTWTPAGGTGGAWELMDDSNLSYLKGPCPGSSGRWTGDGTLFVREDGSSTGAEGQSVLFPWKTLLGMPFPILSASNFKNVRIEFDFYLRDDPEGEAGIVWRGADQDTAQPDRVIDSGYLFRIYDIPDDGSASGRASWELVKRVAMTDYVLASGVVDTSSDPGWPKVVTSGGGPDRWTTDSVNEDFCYRLRIDYYCGYIRAQVKQYNCMSGSCVESDWHTIVEFTDDFTTWGPELEVGTGKSGWIGIYSGNGSSSPGEMNFFDNFDIWSWGDACGPLPTPTNTPPPGPTSTPTPVPPTATPTPTSPPVATPTVTPTPNDGWSSFSEANRENVVFKLLYEGSLLDYSAVPSATEPRIDVAFEPPDGNQRSTFCNGWNLLVDLPDPILTSELDKVRAYLERTSTAIDYVNDDSANFLRWGKNWEEDEALATYNPVPAAATGRTPINNALLDAFDWYVEQVETGGRWADDPLKDCRKWYVVLITDGAESCSAVVRPPPKNDGGGFACDGGNAADRFADPVAYGAESGTEALPVFTIGFAGTAAAAPAELTCISDKTDGDYFGATNAAELRNALYEVLNQLNTEDIRSFSPFKVAPPPSSEGGPAVTQDFLAVYPLFQPIDESSVWEGGLYGFRLNKDQPTIPADANCEVDRTQLVTTPQTWYAGGAKEWDAAARLAEQLAAATPVRPVLMGEQQADNSWARHDLSDVPTDANLQLYIKNRMNEPGGVTDLELQEVVNFVRNIWADNDTSTTPDPRDWDAATTGNQARPAGAPVLGDFYHSQPIVVSPPNRSMFFFDYGFGPAHDYPAFMAKHETRRRVVLAGANDGLLHAFEGGIWDRDRTTDRNGGDIYDKQHDLGTGYELFAYLPNSVMPRLYEMTYGDYQQYMVDGQVAVSDVWIDNGGTYEWRTVAVVGMRRGGRGYVALDITQPDALDGNDESIIPTDQFPGCLDGTTSGCDGEYPKVLWEFQDTNDEEPNCPVAASNCSPYWDLGWTWSKPAIARIGVYNASGTPDDVFVAFFGGGWSRGQVLNDNGTPIDPSDDYLVDTTGRHFYAVNLTTGAVEKKWFIGEYGVPGSPTALDSDIDGFHDRIYFGDTNGTIWRLKYPDPSDTTAIGVDLGVSHVPERLFDFRTDFPDRQQFFTRPVTVPALFGSGGYTWALAMGTGDRANLEHYDPNTSPIDHFFFVLDVDDGVTRDKTDLVGITTDDITGTYECDSALTPDAGGSDAKFGWYLALRPHEKVVFDASVINGHVLFPTFDPTPGVLAEHNTPLECGTTDTPTPVPTGSSVETTICNAAGLSRSYDLWFECGLGEYGENDDVYTGVEDYTIGGTTYVTFTESHDTAGETEEFPNVTGHVVTNWRQD
jgi:hypothetical protein